MRVAAPQNPVPNNRKFDTFSRNHREQLALGAAAKGDRKGHKSKARITVTVRKRPLTPQENVKGESDILAVPTRRTIRVEEPRTKVTGQAYTELHEFRFDRVYGEKCTNQEVYESCVKTLVDAIFESGCRCSCFAFGQTGSGKTYTMVGPKKIGRPQLREIPPEHRGLWDWAAEDLIEWVKKPAWRNYGLYCSFFEIYCNKVYDLLDSRKQVRALESKTADGVVVKDLTIQRVEDESSMISLMDRGLQARITGKNSRNNDSSRGHAIFTVEVKHLEQQSNHGKLAFIDLAGSERGADSMQSGRTTQQDGAGINRSLLALKECIRALDVGSSHVPFRDSELTKVLRDMFITESALTLMIANVSPTDSCCEQTLNTLRYADRVWQMRKHAQPCINENLDAEGDEIPSGEGGAEDGAEWSAAELSDIEGTSDVHQEPSEENSAGGGRSSESDFTEPRQTITEGAAVERKSSDYRTQAVKGARAYPGNRITAAASRAGALNLVGSARGDEIGRQDSNDDRSVTTRKYHPSRGGGGGGAGGGGILPTAVLGRSSIVRPTSPRGGGQPPSSRAARYDESSSIIPTASEGLSLPVSGRGVVKSEQKKTASSRVLKTSVAAATSDYRKLKTSNAFVQQPPPLRSSRPPQERRQRIPTHRHHDLPLSPPAGSEQPPDHQPDPSSDSASAASSSLCTEPAELPGHMEFSESLRSKWRSESPVQSSSYLTRTHGQKLAASAIPIATLNESQQTEHSKHRSHRRRAADQEESPPLQPDYAHLLNASYVNASKSETLDGTSEAIPSDILDLVREVIPSAEPVSSMNLAECPEDELKRRQASSTATGWKSFVDFVIEQQEALNRSCNLTMYHVGLSREMDAMIGPRKLGMAAGSESGGKAVNVAPEKLRDVRAVLEQQVAACVRLGQALAKTETALAVCEQYERELQKRSMQSLQFYQAVEPSRRETRSKKAPSHRALENVKS